MLQLNCCKICNGSCCVAKLFKTNRKAAHCPSSFIDFKGSSGNIQPGYWRESLQFNSQALLSNLQAVHKSQYTEHTVAIRDGLKDYVNSEEGSVTWQWDCVRKM